MSNENIWADIDQHIASLVGQRVFYNHDGTKCLAFVTRAGFDRDTSGHITNTLVVFAPEGILYPVLAHLSSDRMPGSFDIAQPGDLTDSGATPQPEPPVEEKQADTDASPGEQPPNNDAPKEAEFDPADTDKDGVVSPREAKRSKNR